MFPEKTNPTRLRMQQAVAARTLLEHGGESVLELGRYARAYCPGLFEGRVNFAELLRQGGEVPYQCDADFRLTGSDNERLQEFIYEGLERDLLDVASAHLNRMGSRHKSAISQMMKKYDAAVQAVSRFRGDIKD